MRLLLDECLAKDLAREFPGHTVRTVPQTGWASISNGQLLRLIAASGQFDVFVTMDKNLPRQQKTRDLPFAVVVLRLCGTCCASSILRSSRDTQKVRCRRCRFLTADFFATTGRKFSGANPEVLLYSWGMNRITIDPEQCGGRPCIRGMRIRVIDVLDLLANGLTPSQVLEELPDLEAEDIHACLQYASRKLNHPVLVAA